MNDLVIALDASPFFLYGISFAFGAIIGSFINMLAYRIPAMMELQFRQECQYFLADETLGEDPPEVKASAVSLNLFQPSHCPQCDAKLCWWYNIPLLSYLLLRGKCGHCSAAIPIRYFITELVTALLTMLLAMQFGASVHFLLYCLFLWGLITLAVIDFETSLLPDSLTLPLVWLGMGAAYFGWIPLSLSESFLGAVIGYLSLFIFFWIYKILFGKEGFGYGDFKLMAAIGAFIGAPLLLGVVLVGCVSGIITSQLILRIQPGQPFPFGPYLVSGGLLMLFGQDWQITQLLIL